MTTEQKFKNTLEVLGWLQQAGYKVGKSKIYADAKAGMLPAGECTVEDAERYARRARLKRQAAVSGGALDRRAIEKLDLENKHARLKIQRLEIEIAEKSGDLIPAIERDQHIAGVLSILMHKLLHMAQSRSAEMFEVGKKQGPQAMADALQDLIEKEFDDVGRKDELEVLSIANGD